MGLLTSRVGRCVSLQRRHACGPTWRARGAQSHGGHARVMAMAASALCRRVPPNDRSRLIGGFCVSGHAWLDENSNDESVREVWPRLNICLDLHMRSFRWMTRGRTVSSPRLNLALVQTHCRQKCAHAHALVIRRPEGHPTPPQAAQAVRMTRMRSPLSAARRAGRVCVEQYGPGLNNARYGPKSKARERSPAVASRVPSGASCHLRSINAVIAAVSYGDESTNPFRA